MIRAGSLSLFALTLYFMSSPRAVANWVYLVPEEGGKRVMVIHADPLEPDPRVPIEKIGDRKTRLFTLSDSSSWDEIAWEDFLRDPLQNAYWITPPQGTRAIAGTTNYGHFKVHGTETHTKLTYYPKVILDPVSTSQGAIAGEVVPLEVVPIVEDGLLRFQALWKGRPIDAKFEDSMGSRFVISVLPPEGGAMALPVSVGPESTSEDSFETPGRYGAWAVYTIPEAGTVDGKRYTEKRYYATLVLDFQPD